MRAGGRKSWASRGPAGQTDMRLPAPRSVLLGGCGRVPGSNGAFYMPGCPRAPSQAMSGLATGAPKLLDKESCWQEER